MLAQSLKTHTHAHGSVEELGHSPELETAQVSVTRRQVLVGQMLCSADEHQ